MDFLKYLLQLVIWRRNRFLGTGSKICYPVHKRVPGTVLRLHNLVVTADF